MIAQWPERAFDWSFFWKYNNLFCSVSKFVWYVVLGRRRDRTDDDEYFIKHSSFLCLEKKSAFQIHHLLIVAQDLSWQLARSWRVMADPNITQGATNTSTVGMKSGVITSVYQNYFLTPTEIFWGSAYSQFVAQIWTLPYILNRFLSGKRPLFWRPP